MGGHNTVRRCAWTAALRCRSGKRGKGGLRQGVELKRYGDGAYSLSFARIVAMVYALLSGASSLAVCPLHVEV